MNIVIDWVSNGVYKFDGDITENMQKAINEGSLDVIVDGRRMGANGKPEDLDSFDQEAVGG